MQPDADQDEVPLLYKDKELEAAPVAAAAVAPTLWRGAPRIGRRLVPFALLVAVLVFGGLFMIGHVPAKLAAKSPTADDLDLIVRLRLLRSRLEEHYVPTPEHDRAVLTLPAIRRLIKCVEAGSCGPGERDIVLLASTRFSGATKGAVSGENIWAASTIRAFREMNTTLFFAAGSMDTLLMYQHVPELVRTIFWEGSSLDACIERNGTGIRNEGLAEDYRRAKDNWQGGEPKQEGCMVRDDFPDGIPYYKSLVFHFWGEPRTPLGREFTLAPWDFSKMRSETNRFLGFSIEDHCMTNHYYAPQERKHEALILGKLAKYFHPGKENWITPDTLKEAVQDLPKENGEEFKLISTAKETDDNPVPAILPEPIVSLGYMKQAEWTDLLAKSKVMIGLGWPAYSPSPFDALCVGVPFINPINYVDEAHPDDRSKWHTQNDPLLALDPPYVYHVRKDNATMLHEALKQAIENPIQRFIPEEMKFENVLERHRVLLNRNWPAVAEAQVERLYGGDPAKEYLLLPGANTSAFERIHWLYSPRP